MELRVLTLSLNAESRAFDDAPLRALPPDREVLRVDRSVVHVEDEPLLVLVVGLEPPSGAGAPPEPPVPRSTDGWRQRLSPEDRAIFEALVAWRADRAKRDDLAPYRVAGNRVLAALSAMRPRDEEELLEVPGIGEARLRSYGAELLQILRGAVPDTDDPEAASEGALAE